MTNSPLHGTISALVSPILSSLNLTLWGIDIVAGGKMCIRVYVDSEQGAGIDECALVSRQLGLTLDVEDSIPNAYTLEVSTPGLERPFFAVEQLANYMGDKLEVALIAPQKAFPDRRKFVGILKAVEGESFTLELCPLGPEKQVKPAKNKKNAAAVEAAPAPEREMLTAEWREVKKAKRLYEF